MEKDIVNPFYEMPWFMNDGVSGDFTEEKKNSKIFYMTHTFYNDNMPTSNRLNKLNTEGIDFLKIELKILNENQLIDFLNKKL